MMLPDELLAYIFDGRPHILAPSMGMWLASSRRFTVFASTFRDKIRKKLRSTQDTENLLDLRLELETAYLLLEERAFSLVYESQQAEHARGPDFAVSYTTSMTFMVEVTRVRVDKAEQKSETPAPNPAPPIPFLALRVADAVCGKPGQLLPQRSNVLLVGVESSGLTTEDLRATMLNIQQRAERNDPTFLQRYRFRDRADFFRQYQRLSEVLVRGTRLQEAEPPIAWINPQAKHPLPGKVRSALYHSHRILANQVSKTPN